MAALEKKKPLAIDSNLLFDLAGKKDFALTFLEVAIHLKILRRGVRQIQSKPIKIPRWALRAGRNNFLVKTANGSGNHRKQHVFKVDVRTQFYVGICRVILGVCQHNQVRVISFGSLAARYVFASTRFING